MLTRQNTIRQYTWRDYYARHPDVFVRPSNATEGGDAGLPMHVDHCIEMLRLALACQADTTPPFIVRDAEAGWLERADFEGTSAATLGSCARWMAESEKS